MGDLNVSKVTCPLTFLDMLVDIPLGESIRFALLVWKEEDEVVLLMALLLLLLLEWACSANLREFFN